MARIPDAFIDELLARTDIVEVIGARVPLKKQGREYTARCPFHDERSPSFTVSPDKQFYHCFGCGAHGTAITFLIEYERLEFLDAIDELARRVGMSLPRQARQWADDDGRSQLYPVLEAAGDFFRQQLAASPRAQTYLDQRRIDPITGQQFAIGYAPSSFSALRDALGSDAGQITLLERAGLLSRNEDGHVYDKFRDRLMFPIHDQRGRVIAFGGRVITAEDAPKYLNSPETALFHKSRELYGLWQARQAQTRPLHLIVVEGYLDVIALSQHGVAGAVATLGTATTAEHVERLFRATADVYFCFDGDTAGRRAADKAMDAALPRIRDGRQAFFLFLPEGEDPDTLVRREGADGFQARLRQAAPLSQALFERLCVDIDLSTLDGKARLAERARPVLEQIPDGAFADLMRQRLSELTGLPARRPAAATHHRIRTNAPASPPPRRSLVRSAITLLLQHPKLGPASPTPIEFAELRQPGVALLLELLALIRTRPDISTGALLRHLEGRDDASALQRLAAHSLPGDIAGWQAEYDGAIQMLNMQTRQQRRAELQQRDFASLSEAEKDELRRLLRMRLPT